MGLWLCRDLEVVACRAFGAIVNGCVRSSGAVGRFGFMHFIVNSRSQDFVSKEIGT